jgi:hypothetical protein
MEALRGNSRGFHASEPREQTYVAGLQEAQKP